MKPQAVAALAGASLLYLLKRRRQNRLQEDVAPLPPLVLPQHGSPSGPAALGVPLGLPPSSLAASTASERASGVSSSSAKSVVGAVLQWVFLILLGAAIATTAAKGAWDVFGLLLAAALVQLGGQLAKWMAGAAGDRGSGSRRGGSKTPRAPRASAADASSAAAAAAAVAVARPVVLRADPRLAGVWVKDGHRSETMEPALKLMHLNGIVRTAVKLIRGLEIDPRALAAGRMDLAIFSVIAWFKVRESYPLDGTVGHFNRRDLRRGKHAASVAVQPDGSLLLTVSWGEPLSGSGNDHFVLVPGGGAAATSGGGGGGGELTSAAAARDDDLLVVTSTLRLAGADGPTVSYRTVYHRGGRGKHHHGQAQAQAPHASLPDADANGTGGTAASQTTQQQVPPPAAPAAAAAQEPQQVCAAPEAAPAPVA
ncbi:hypothetical protein HYH03_014984 [Edaphochlamys debaryana]|uniref:Uncharacterized protein n=1 Tax=Edaphochlamys debaryana TaxID=47281 RepID=A0A835XLS6_9CHLO|nr:hypothetical protein HYH03_014984 [Edaphochlamys debaryana]|eukprot:KAG2486408.1 hypothetical protein HYH03_014984 [Edaphochlamys debaryana]